MRINTGDNLTIIKTDIAQECGKKLLFKTQNITLETVTGDKIKRKEKSHSTSASGITINGIRLMLTIFFTK